jgi:hypothetical protein
VYACPHDAAHRVDPRKFFAEIADRSRTGEIKRVSKEAERRDAD